LVAVRNDGCLFVFCFFCFFLAKRAQIYLHVDEYSSNSKGVSYVW
jgi:hypothetical protein